MAKIKIEDSEVKMEGSVKFFAAFLKMNKRCRDSMFEKKGCCDCPEETIEFCNNLLDKLMDKAQTHPELLDDLNEDT